MNRLMQRNLLLAAVVALVVVAAGVGWFFGSQIRSPAELAAQAQPPAASNITVEVVRQVLSADVITRGEVVHDQPAHLTLSGGFAEPFDKLVVTQAADVGDELAEGERLVEVVGRPVFLLTGEIPMYRDLRPGASGDDVLQVQEAMVRLGYLDGTPDGTWAAATSHAVAAWYDDHGYRPNGLSEEDEAVLRAARDRVRAAEGAVADSRAAVTEATRGSGEAGRLQAQSEIRAAQAAVDLARLDAEAAVADAQRAERLARGDVRTAEQALARAEQRLAEAEAGTHPDTGQPPTSVERTELRREVAAARSALADAQADADAATLALQRTRKEQQALVRQAEDAVAIARAALRDLDRATDTSSLRRQVTAAGDELAQAREELADLEAGLGTWLPAGEVVFLAHPPVRVDQVVAARGSMIEGTFVVVSGADLALRTSVRERDAGLLSEGMAVEIELPDGDTTIPGTITEVASRPGTHNLPGDRVYVEVEPGELPEELIGQNVRVTIPVSSTAGEVLAVPAAALSATANGSTIVEVDEEGSLRTVTVRTGLASGGLVEVTPVDGELAAGDLVVVGRDHDGSSATNKEGE